MNNSIDMEEILPKNGFLANSEEHMSAIEAHLKNSEGGEGGRSNAAVLAARAKDGDQLAQYYYGVSLALGYGCEKNNKLAFFWFMQAAVEKEAPKKKDASPENESALEEKAAPKKKVSRKDNAAIEKKPVPEPDPATKALIEKCRVEAALRVGDCFFYGKGVARSYVKAAHWYGKAAAKGNEEGEKKVSSCKCIMNPIKKEKAKGQKAEPAGKDGKE